MSLFETEIIAKELESCEREVTFIQFLQGHSYFV